MRSMTFEKAYTNSTHNFIPVTCVHQVNPLVKSQTEKMCSMILEVAWTNSTHEFTLKTLSKPNLNSVDIESMTLEVVSTNSAHAVTL